MLGRIVMGGGSKLMLVHYETHHQEKHQIGIFMADTSQLVE